MTLDDLRSEFSQEIIDALDAITFRKRRETFLEYVKRCSLNPIALRVKILDIEHNRRAPRLSLCENLNGDEILAREDRYQDALIILEAADHEETPEVPTSNPARPTLRVVDPSESV